MKLFSHGLTLTDTDLWKKLNFHRESIRVRPCQSVANLALVRFQGLTHSARFHVEV